MHPQITVVTIGVFDLDRAKQFYADGLGCPISADHGVFVSFDLGGGSLLGVYGRSALATEAGVDPVGSGFSGVTFHYLVETRGAVDELLARVAAATIELVGSGGRDAVRFCDAPSCGDFFAPDRRDQRWCDDSCGTRARVARHAAHARR